MHSACDRQSFALGPFESRTGQRGSREKRHSDALQWEGSPFSAVQLIGWKSLKMGTIRELWGKLRRKFSAFQTVWRRGRHSNLRYRSLSRKARGVRKLRITKLQQRFFVQNARFDFLISAVSFRYSIYPKRRIPGDSVAESGQLSEPFLHRQIPTQ